MKNILCHGVEVAAGKEVCVELNAYHMSQAGSGDPAIQIKPTFIAHLLSALWAVTVTRITG